MATSPACQSTPAKVRPLAGVYKWTGVPPHRASTRRREEGQQNGLKTSEGVVTTEAQVLAVVLAEEALPSGTLGGRT